MAVCSLAVSVTTRYCSPETAPSSAVKARCGSSPERGRQRLTDDAANWIPPVIVSSPLEEPASYPPVAAEKPAVADPSFASLLYYRPPPFSDFHS
jgi:hypothetical protein